MASKVSEFLSVFGILFLFACFAPCIEAGFNPESFQRKLVALEKVLDYVNNRPHQMNVDVTFAITLTEANLVATLLHENVQYLESRFFIALKEMVVLSDLTRRNLMNIVPANKTEFLLQLILNNPNLWIKSISWTKIFPRAKIIPSQELNYREVVESIQYGTPNETESDRCLVGITYSDLNGKCQIPEICVETLMRNDGTTGYPLTHRLLIVQVAKALGCREIESAPFFYLIPAYCARILRDLINLEAWNFPHIARDLMMEQIVLCGMEGYYEFVDKHYEDLILSWPQPSGCFGLFEFPERYRITRRSSSPTDFGCENHMTGLAAASLSVFIRENVENALSPS